jgi:putative phage-type endonuclease
MTAVLIPASSEAEWLAARRQGVTASEIAILLGLSPYGSPFALFHQKRGDLPDQEDNLSMAIGRHFEDFVADRFMDRFEYRVVVGDGRELYAHPDRPWQMATPDRTVWEAGTGAPYFGSPLAVLECKTDGGFDGWGDDGTDEIPVHYRCQVLWQMDVMGVGTGYLACLFMNRRQLRVYELTMDDQARADLALMLNEAERFLARFIDGRAPDVDWRPATAAALKHLHPGLEDREVVISSTLAGKYRGACAAVKRAEQRKKLAENQIRARLGNGRKAVRADGEVIARRDVYDLAEKQVTRKASTVDRLVLAKIQEPTP